MARRRSALESKGRRQTVVSAAQTEESGQMTECRIEKVSDGVTVEVDGVEPRQQAKLLAAFNDCQQGH